MKVLVISPLIVILTKVIDNIVNKSEVQVPVYILGMPHPEGLFSKITRSAIGPDDFCEWHLSIHKKVLLRQIHEWIIIVVEKLSGSVTLSKKLI